MTIDYGSWARGLSILCACCILLPSPCVISAQDDVLVEDFEDISDWQQQESHGQGGAIIRDTRVEIASHRDGTRPSASLRITDRSVTDHWFWIQKRRKQGWWDFSRARTVTFWARTDRASATVRFLVGDDRGNIAYYLAGSLAGKEWEMKSLDLLRNPPFARQGTVDWCRIAVVGLRTDPGHSYTVDFDDLRVQAGEEHVLPGEDAGKLTRPAILRQPLLGFLAPVSSADLNDSLIGVNLAGTEAEKEFDLLERAGVKWAKLACFLPRSPSPRTDYVVDSLRKRGLNVVGQLPQALPWNSKLFPDVKGKPEESCPLVYSPTAMEWYKQRVQATAEHFRGRIRVWEIGNEPDIGEFWRPTPDPAAFARFVMQTSKVLKAVDPQNQVINGGVCGFYTPGFSVARNFLTTFFKTGAGAHIDYLGLHPYRAHSESGAPDMSQRQAADEVRRLAAEFGRRLPLWDTEWQSTPVVDRKEVPFATDLYQAKNMLRKYLVEADAGFTHMNWQICKASARLDHPGQIFTAVGRPTAKYVTLSHVGALFSKLSTPVESRVRLATRPDDFAISLLNDGNLDEPSSLQRWKASPDPRVLSMDTQASFRGRSALRLSGGGPVAINSVQRWKPILGAVVLEARCLLKGDGCEVAIYPTPRNALGEELPRAAPPKRALIAEPNYRPVCLRFDVEGAWHDFGIRVELPKRGATFINDLTFVHHVPPIEITSFAFKLQGSTSSAVFFWTPIRPSDEQRSNVVDIAIKSLPAADYLLLDTLTGECRRLSSPERNGDEAIFRGVPLCDYPMGIVPMGVFQTAACPVWLAACADSNEIVDRAFIDRTGDFYLRGFWRTVFDLVERGVLEEANDKVIAVKRMRAFWRTFPVTRGEIAVTPLAPVRMTLRPEPGAWRDSVANTGSQNVNRHFYQVDDADSQAAVHGMRMGGRALPERPWADSPQNASTWFPLYRKGQPTEVFVVVPKDQVFDGRGCEIDLSFLPRTRAILLATPTGEAQCVAYWTEAVGGDGHNTCTLEVEDRAGWPSGAVIINPRTGMSCGEAAARKLEGSGRIAITVPAAPHPLLLVPRQSVQRVTEALAIRGHHTD